MSTAAGFGGSAAFGASAPLPEIAPIAPWERAAVELAMRYLDSGPGGWWPRLAEGSPLAGGGRERALAEIAVRAGAAAEASWELQTVLPDALAEGAPAFAPTHPEGAPRTAVFAVRFPSGIEELLQLDLVEAADGWRLWDLRGAADARDAPPAPAPIARTAANAAEQPASTVALASRSATADTATAPFAGTGRRPWISPSQRVLGPLLGLVLLIAGAAVRRKSRVLAWLLVILGLAAILLALFLPGPIAWDMPILGPEPDDTAPPSDATRSDTPADPRSLAALSELRTRLTSSPVAARPQGSAEAVATPLAATSAAGAAATPYTIAVAQIWQAQALLAAGDLADTEAALARVSAPSRYPLAELLRARLSAQRGEAVEAALGYGRALAALPATDGLLLEAADALASLGLGARAEALYQRLAAGGSRAARVHQRLIHRAAIQRREQVALAHLETVLRLEPPARAELLSDPIRSYLVRRHGLFNRLRLEDPREPAPAATVPGPNALEPPPGWQARYTGETLWLTLGTAEVSVPGGVALLPAGALPLDPLQRRQTVERRVLASPARALPASQLETAALALARDRRWDELLAFTTPLAARGDLLPPQVGQLRAEALRRTGRPAEAARLLVATAKSNAAAHRQDPLALLHLAWLLMEVEEWDLAIAAAQTGEAQMLEKPLFSMIPRIRMERQLAEDYETHSSRHFLVRYPAGTNRYFVEQLTEVLEKEVTRLQAWIPYLPSEPVEVHLFPFREFFQHYSQGGEAIGVFDGKVRVPLAELPSLHPSVVAILTHELAHALITGATGDRAPAWFQEGLAQHVQMMRTQVNPIPDYQREGKLVAFPLLDPIFDGRSDPLFVELAYDEAAWALHYVEQRHGRRAIHRLLDAFHRGLPTEPAIAEVFDKTLPEFDRDLWKWATVPTGWSTELIRYDR